MRGILDCVADLLDPQVGIKVQDQTFAERLSQRVGRELIHCRFKRRLAVWYVLDEPQERAREVLRRTSEPDAKFGQQAAHPVDQRRASSFARSPAAVVIWSMSSPFLNCRLKLQQLNLGTSMPFDSRRLREGELPYIRFGSRP
jgi:hypothetical protein